MTFFFDRYIRPFLSEYPDVRLLEIGASEGNHSDRLLSLPGASLTIIDPCIDKPLDEIYASNDHVRVIKDISLNALPNVGGQFDAIFIDGDHNWYTVYNELLAIETHRLLASNGVIFFHDVAWPYGRRDMYYRPDLIPPENRHPFLQSGIIRGVSELVEGGSNADLHNATMEGGQRNGVLTAIEDFIKHTGKEYKLFAVDEEHGLGIVVRAADRKARSRVGKLVSDRKWELRKADISSRFPWAYGVLKRIMGR